MCHTITTASMTRLLPKGFGTDGTCETPRWDNLTKRGAANAEHLIVWT